MNSIHLPELELARQAYEDDGEKFAFVLTADPRLGYYVEPWTNQCLVGPGPRWTKDQPKPISDDWDDDRIGRQKEIIEAWIADRAHALAVAAILRQIPAGWKPLGHAYEADWPEIEFGASVVLFRVG